MQPRPIPCRRPPGLKFSRVKTSGRVTLSNPLESFQMLSNPQKTEQNSDSRGDSWTGKDGDGRQIWTGCDRERRRETDIDDRRPRSLTDHDSDSRKKYADIDRSYQKKPDVSRGP